MKKISQTTPLLIDGYMIIGLAKNWMKIFNGLPRFDVFLDSKRRLHLISGRGK